MKVHVVFSLNLTSSIANDIIRVVSSVGYCLYGYLFAKNVLEIIRHRIRINMKRKIFSHDNIVQQHF